MGARADPITREAFVVPHEFRNLGSTANATGRVGGARIELVREGSETRLGFCYQQIPMRVMTPFNFDGEQAALLYLVTLTTGLLDGDAHHIELVARAGTRAVVTGQSASRVHPALVSFATQQWDVTVEEDACLVVLPGPTIPFAGARYYQRGRANLAPSARLIWGDIWLPGRYDRGGALSERFQFERIVQDFEIRRAGRLVYRDRFRWDGPWSAADVAWYWGGELACGSLFVGGPMPDALPEAGPGVRRSIFRLDTGECCVRWCGHPAAVTADLAATALRCAAHWTVAPEAPWFLAKADLSPNHWFSPPGV